MYGLLYLSDWTNLRVMFDLFLGYRLAALKQRDQQSGEHMLLLEKSVTLDVTEDHGV